MIKRILLYTTENGKCPVQDFLDTLSEKVFKKIIWVINLVTELKSPPKTYFKKLINTDDIWECRIQLGSNSYRIFCFFDNNELIILTHGLVKKTQKTPPQEIEKAEKYKNDYFRRKNDD